MKYARRFVQAAQAPARVLVVDDAQSQRQHVAQLMRGRCALQVVEAANGVQALKRLQEHTFNLVVTDVEMPLLDGVKFTHLVRRGSSNPRVPIVVLTSSFTDEVRHAALAAGASACLPKTTADEDVVGQVLALLGIMASA